MKKMIVRLSAMLFAVLALTSCNSEETTATKENDTKGVTINADIKVNGTQKMPEKINYNENTTTKQMEVTWSAGTSDDAFYFCDYYHAERDDSETYPIWGSHVAKFVKSNTASGKTASFTTTDLADIEYEENKDLGNIYTLSAVYPYHSYTKGTTIPSLLFYLTGQIGSKSTLDRYDYMVAKSASYTGNLSAVNFTFEHKIVVLKLNLTIDGVKSGTCKNVTLHAASGLNNQKYYNLKTGAYETSGATSGDITINHEWTIGDNGKVADPIYMVIFPEKLESPYITATVGSEKYVIYMKDFDFSSYMGKVVSVDVKLKQPIPVVGYYLYSTGRYSSNNDDGKAIARIFWVGDVADEEGESRYFHFDKAFTKGTYTNGLAVALKDVEIGPWLVYNSLIPNSDFATSCYDSFYEGVSNYNALYKASSWTTARPANSSHWFLPCMNELFQINRATTIAKTWDIGSENFLPDGTYWSANTYTGVDGDKVYAVQINGTTATEISVANYSNEYHSIRPIIAF